MEQIFIRTSSKLAVILATVNLNIVHANLLYQHYFTYNNARSKCKLNYSATMAEADITGFSISISSAVRGHHVYKNRWTPYLDEVLQTWQEHGNSEDRYAVAVGNEAEGSTGLLSVGHVPRELSKVCWYFIGRGGEIGCRITASRRRSPLPQGGLEVPCIYKFIGKKKDIEKLRKLLKDNSIVDQ